MNLSFLAFSFMRWRTSYYSTPLCPRARGRRRTNTTTGRTPQKKSRKGSPGRPPRETPGDPLEDPPHDPPEDPLVNPRSTPPRFRRSPRRIHMRIHVSIPNRICRRRTLGREPRSIFYRSSEMVGREPIYGNWLLGNVTLGSMGTRGSSEPGPAR